MENRVTIRQRDTVLLADGPGAERELSPEEVYSSHFFADERERCDLADALWPNGLEFNRFPLRPSVGFQLTDDGVRPHIEFTLRGGRAVILKVMPPSAQVILGHAWYPILREDYTALRELLLTEPGAPFRTIDLRDFVGMCRHPAAERILGKARHLGVDAVTELVRGADLGAAATLAPDVTLRPYQQVGCRWLYQMTAMGTGGILADEMGLGKTLQVIALMSTVAASETRPILLVVPSSLVPNWRRELLRFCPSLSWIIHRGSSRSSSGRYLQQFDIVLTTYDILVVDQSLFVGVDWALFVCDEAHLLRNPDTSRFRAMSFLRSRFPTAPAIAVTGTPIQNSLRDAWALLEYVLPGYGGARDEFSDAYCDDVQSAVALEPRLSPFMLRRLVEDVAQDLPPLIHIPQELEMTDSEALGYEELRSRLVYSPGGMLAAMTPLRMWCCHPRLKEADWAQVDVTSTAKFSRLVEVVLDIRRMGEKALIFTTYNDMARMIQEYFGGTHGIWCDTVSGEDRTEERQEIIDRFSDRTGAALLVLNPQAAGLGLNIQAANHVLHYNLEWNPAVEEQATARAYRRGQVRAVRVHRFYYRNTIEEVINARVDLKRCLITTAVRGVTGEEASDVAVALSLSPLASTDREAHVRS